MNASFQVKKIQCVIEMINHKYIRCIFLFFIIFLWGSNLQGVTNQLETPSIGQEVKFLLIIDKHITPELLSSFYDEFYSNESLWPILVPTALPSFDYHSELSFQLNGWSVSNVCYGDAYRNGKVLYQNQSSLLMIQPELSSTELYTMVSSLYQNFTWSYSIYVDYDRTEGYSITLEFTSPPNSEDQVWTGRFVWSYDDKGIAERFDFTVWRMTTALLSDYDPIKDESKLIAFYNFVFETPRNYNIGFGVIIFFLEELHPS